MDVLPILKWPDERLHLPSEDVTVFDTALKDFGDQMFKTVKTNNGIGLAAPQVNVQKNIIAIWVEEQQPLILINPKIIESSTDTTKFNEGCLSVPGFYENRLRPTKVTIEFKDVDGKECKLEFTGLTAFCIQHEIDHLKGKLFIDDFSDLKKSIVKKKIKKTLGK